MQTRPLLAISALPSSSAVTVHVPPLPETVKLPFPCSGVTVMPPTAPFTVNSVPAGISPHTISPYPFVPFSVTVCPPPVTVISGAVYSGRYAGIVDSVGSLK